MISGLKCSHMIGQHSMIVIRKFRNVSGFVKDLPDYPPFEFVKLVQEPARARRFRERRKADAARNFSAATNLASTSTTGIPVLMNVTNDQTATNLASTSTTGIPVLMEVTNEQTIDISIGSATELRDLNISRSEAMQKSLAFSGQTLQNGI
ncbi:hypothetical protein TNCV_4432471 [Trichonephila clavipes]|nr:hypothetical protein TNCV_4432471 [Trichonephila clavipes]